MRSSSGEKVLRFWSGPVSKFKTDRFGQIRCLGTFQADISSKNPGWCLGRSDRSEYIFNLSQIVSKYNSTSTEANSKLKSTSRLMKMSGKHKVKQPTKHQTQTTNTWIPVTEGNQIPKSHSWGRINIPIFSPSSASSECMWQLSQGDLCHLQGELLHRQLNHLMSWHQWSDCSGEWQRNLQASAWLHYANMSVQHSKLKPKEPLSSFILNSDTSNICFKDDVISRETPRASCWSHAHRSELVAGDMMHRADSHG